MPIENLAAEFNPDLPVSREARLDDVVVAFQSLEIRNAAIAAALASTLGIGAPDMRALLWVARSDNAVPKNLAKHLELSTGAITTLLDRLVTAGLVIRQPNATDRRSVLVILTPRGCEAVEALNDFYRRAFDDVIDDDRLAFVAEGFHAVNLSLSRTALEFVVASNPGDVRPIGQLSSDAEAR